MENRLLNKHIKYPGVRKQSLFMRGSTVYLHVYHTFHPRVVFALCTNVSTAQLHPVYNQGKSSPLI